MWDKEVFEKMGKKHISTYRLEIMQLKQWKLNTAIKHSCVMLEIYFYHILCNYIYKKMWI